MKEVFNLIRWAISDVLLTFFNDDTDIISLEAKKMYQNAVRNGYEGNIYEFIKEITK